ncbi:MAG: hypothetical protein GY749_10315 [Desulfobacteraceae bacterium]|nr:hypothetical protein [Desulfobacteraceae bacterium]
MIANLSNFGEAQPTRFGGVYRQDDASDHPNISGYLSGNGNSSPAFAGSGRGLLAMKVELCSENLRRESADRIFT